MGANMKKKLSYKSFFWSIGTTSFRMKQFNRMIEEQLRLLNEFWSIKKNQKLKWNKSTQEQYYNFMKEQSFITGNETKKDKNAREKTSGLVDLGLISADRRLTNVGQKLLDISLSGDFSSDNELLIEKDSFLYMKQLLKTSYKINSEFIRPFVLLLYVLSKYETISFDEFKYLLPLCIDKNSTKKMVKNISSIKNNKKDIDSIIVETFMSMENYQDACNYFLKEKIVTKDLIVQIGMNRKSDKYDKQYYDTYNLLKEIFINKRYTKLQDFYFNIKSLRLSKYWVKYFFDNGSKKKVTSNDLKDNDFNLIKDEKELREVFFKFLHLNKIKATLDDYFDLNKRYIGLSDIINFQDNQISLSIVPKIYFNPIIDDLYNSICFTESNNLTDDVKLININKNLELSEKILISNYNNIYNKKIKTISEIKKEYENNRYERFEKLLNDNFKKEKLLELLDDFKERNDNKINKSVTMNADIPTIFEYIIGIIWYEISERKGDILSYMNLSLDADLLPKTHAAGGIADIIYKYENTKEYPEHSLLIEVTLTDKMNQRRMEMEPVSRHLGEYLLKNKNNATYCVFITNFLDINVLNDFRSRKNRKFYDTKDYSRFIDGMKIIPIETDIIKLIIEKEYEYKKLYDIFDKAYLNDMEDKEWYDDLKTKINL